MKNRATQLFAFVVATLFVLSGVAMGQQSDQEHQWKSTKQDTVQGSSGKTVQPDNSGVNKRDQRDEGVTADKQSQSAADVELTRKIRRAIVEDDSLSTYAHNVKIITRDGLVTLKGPVHSEQEKLAIEAKAAAMVGAGKIKNEIEVKAAKSNSRND